MSRKPVCALAAVALGVGACGGSEPDRFSLRTPGANTGEAAVVGPQPSATPSATPTPKPKVKAAGPPVTREEKRIIRGWSEALRHGHVAAASRYFAIPSLVSNNDPGTMLGSKRNVEDFNRALPCGAKLIRTVRGKVPHSVVGTFTLTDRPGGQCGGGTGEKAFVAFVILRHHITQWVRVDQSQATPQAAPTPTPSAGSDSGSAA